MDRHKDEFQFHIINDGILKIINQYLHPEKIESKKKLHNLTIYDTEKELNLKPELYNTLMAFMNGHRFLIISNGYGSRFDSSLNGTLEIINSYFDKNKIKYL